MANPVWQYMSGLSSFGGNLGITLGALSGGNTPASSAFPASDDAIFIPVYLRQSVLIKRLFVINGATVSGNIDVGIYSKDGGRIISAGSTAQSGTSAAQFFDITDIVIGSGVYYLAVSLDNTTGTLFRASIPVTRLQAIGVAKMASAFALPSTATLASVTDSYLPLIGAEIAEIR